MLKSDVRFPTAAATDVVAQGRENREFEMRIHDEAEKLRDGYRLCTMHDSIPLNPEVFNSMNFDLFSAV